jgi:hypothetical protein
MAISIQRPRPIWIFGRDGKCSRHPVAEEVVENLAGEDKPCCSKFPEAKSGL